MKSSKYIQNPLVCQLKIISQFISCSESPMEFTLVSFQQCEHIYIIHFVRVDTYRAHHLLREHATERYENCCDEVYPLAAMVGPEFLSIYKCRGENVFCTSLYDALEVLSFFLRRAITIVRDTSANSSSQSLMIQNVCMIAS